MPLANNTLSDLSGLKSVFIGQYCVWPAVQTNNDEEYIHESTTPARGGGGASHLGA